MRSKRLRNPRAWLFGGLTLFLAARIVAVAGPGIYQAFTEDTWRSILAVLGIACSWVPWVVFGRSRQILLAVYLSLAIIVYMRVL